MHQIHSHLITDNRILADACHSWQNCPVLTLDTEFIRTSTFYPIPALLQVFDGKDCCLIDPLSITDFSPLRTLLLSPSTLKVLHSCSEDLEVFDRLLQTLPSPLFDTQIAAAFLGYGFSAGYARLIKTLYHIDIPKDQTRSDWLQRPLTESQLNYAALDVIYLYKLYEKFSTELKSSDKTIWAEACNRELTKQFYQNQRPDQYFSRLKNSWQLDLQQQQVLFHLSLWREDIARARNKPRSHILSDEALFELALKQPASMEGLKKLSHLSPGILKHHGQDLLSLLLLEKEKPFSTSTGPWQAAPEPLPREAGDILKHLKRLTDDAAERLNIAPEMLARKKDFQALVSSAIGNHLQLPGSLTGWRQPIIGDVLLKATQQWQLKRQAG